MKTTVYVVGTLKQNERREWVLSGVDVYSEPAWSLTQQVGPELVFVQMLPGVVGDTFSKAQGEAQALAERCFSNLEPRLFAWK